MQIQNPDLGEALAEYYEEYAEMEVWRDRAKDQQRIKQDYPDLANDPGKSCSSINFIITTRNNTTKHHPLL